MSTAEKDLEETLHKAHELGIFKETTDLATKLQNNDVALRYNDAIEIAFNKLSR